MDGEIMTFKPLIFCQNFKYPEKHFMTSNHKVQDFRTYMYDYYVLEPKAVYIAYICFQD